MWPPFPLQAAVALDRTVLWPSLACNTSWIVQVGGSTGGVGGASINVWVYVGGWGGGCREGIYQCVGVGVGVCVDG